MSDIGLWFSLCYLYLAYTAVLYLLHKSSWRGFFPFQGSRAGISTFFFIVSQTVNILGFVVHIVSVETTQLCPIAAIYSEETSRMVVFQLNFI